jgi:hypothetical protein
LSSILSRQGLLSTYHERKCKKSNEKTTGNFILLLVLTIFEFFPQTNAKLKPKCSLNEIILGISVHVHCVIVG